MVAKLVEVASYCQSLAGPGVSVMAAVREFIVKYTRHPASVSDPYYAAITAPKNWDVVMTDLWKRIPAVSGTPYVLPALLCFDASDIMVMILGALGIQARTVRGIALQPLTSYGGRPGYLDHTFVEVWCGWKWAAQDPFYNVEYLISASDYASADDLCGYVDLLDITPRNAAAVTGGVSKTGWVDTGTDTLRVQDFFAAIEHRDDAGNSVVVMNGNRADFSTLFCVSDVAAPTPIRQLIVGSVKRPQPTVVEIRALPAS